jgi:hypothetical protein
MSAEVLEGLAGLVRNLRLGWNSLRGVSVSVNNISENFQVDTVDRVEYDRRVRIGIAREALLLGALVYLVWIAVVLYLRVYYIHEGMETLPFYTWMLAGPVIVVLNLFLPYAERRTGVIMQEPGAIRTARDNRLLSVLVFMAWAFVGLAISASNLIIDPTIFFIAGLTVYYLAGSLYNRRLNWGPMAKGKGVRSE